MRTRTCLAACGSVLAATIGLLGAAASASASTTTPVVGYTYLDGNTATANTIDAFARHADGSVTPLAGAPFAAGGAGTGAGLASQGAIQVTRDGRYLLAVDAGSNQVSVLRLTPGGVPVLVGHPVSSGGIQPVSVAVSPSGLVYVANSGAAGSNYSGFRLLPGGTLVPIPGATFAVPGDSGLGDVFFNAFGNHLIGTRTGTSQIDSFVVLPGGTAAARARLAVHRPGARAARGRVLAGPARPAVRQQRPQRRRAGHDLRVPGQPARPAHPGRRVALRGRPDRALLGRDQPRRPVPVHRQHRLGQHLQLRHQPVRVAHPDRQHADQGRRRGHRRPAVAGRPDADGGRQRRAHPVGVRGQRRSPDRGAQLADAAARRRCPGRDRQHLAATGG